MALKNKVEIIKYPAIQPIDNLEKIIRAAIYARYSSIGNSHHSAEEQVARIRHKVKMEAILSTQYPNAKIVIDETWVIQDEAKTGRVSRAGYDRLLQGIDTNSFDILLVDDISRLTRDMGTTIDLYDRLNFKGIEGISISESSSTKDPSARDIWVFKGFTNEATSKATSRNTMRGLEMRVVDGYSTGHCPYGYRSFPTKTQTVKGVERGSHFEIKIHEEEAKVIVKIFELYVGGMGTKKIAEFLNEQGIPSPSRGKNLRWVQKTIYSFLKQEKYFGKWKYRHSKVIRNPMIDKLAQQSRPQDEWLDAIREELRIVPIDLQGNVERVFKSFENQERVHKNLIRSGSHCSTLFVGVISCNECKGNFITVAGKGYMGCFNAHRVTTVKCSNRQTVNIKLLEGNLIDEIIKAVSNEETHKYLAKQYNTLTLKRQGSIPQQLEELDSAVSRDIKVVENLLRFIETGNFSEHVIQRLKDTEATLKLNKQKRDYMHEQLGNQVYITAANISAKLKSLPDMLKTKVIAANQILRKLFPDKIILVPINENGKSKYRADGSLSFHSIVGGAIQNVPISRVISKVELYESGG